MNADGMSRQCGQCQRPDCPVSAMGSPFPDAEPETEMVDQPFAASEMGELMDADLLPELSGETWVASALIEEFTAVLLPAGSNVDLIAASRQDVTLATVREWIQSESTPAWAECAGFSPGCSNVCRIVHCVHSKEISMPSKGSYGPCVSRPPMGESRHGLVGHVNHVGEGKSLCVSNGGLLLSVDGGLSAS